MIEFFRDSTLNKRLKIMLYFVDFFFLIMESSIIFKVSSVISFFKIIVEKTLLPFLKLQTLSFELALIFY